MPAVDGERTERADVTLLRVDRLPRGKEAQRVVYVVVDQQRAAHAVHTGCGDGICELGQRGERSVAVGRARVLEDDVLGSREQRIPATDKDEIAGAVGKHSRREAMV